METKRTVVYKVELANKCFKGRAVGNLYGVGKYVNGCRQGYSLTPQQNEQVAIMACRDANVLESSC